MIPCTTLIASYRRQWQLVVESAERGDYEHCSASFEAMETLRGLLGMRHGDILRAAEGQNQEQEVP